MPKGIKLKTTFLFIRFFLDVNVNAHCFRPDVVATRLLAGCINGAVLTLPTRFKRVFLFSLLLKALRLQL